MIINQNGSAVNGHSVANSNPTSERSLQNQNSIDKSTQSSPLMLHRYTDTHDIQGYSGIHSEITGGDRRCDDEERPHPDAEKFRREIEDGVTTTMPLKRYIVCAANHAMRYASDPDTPSWHDALFVFARFMKGHPEITMLGAGDALMVVKSAMARIRKGDWFDGYPGQWGEMFNMDAEEADSQWLAVWEKIVTLPGRNPLDNALELASKLPVQILPEIAVKRSQRYPLFVGMVMHLQRARGDASIYLPVREVGEKLKVRPITVTRYRQWAVEDGFLVVVKEHSFRPGGRGRATEFRANTSMFEWQD